MGQLKIRFSGQIDTPGVSRSQKRVSRESVEVSRESVEVNRESVEVSWDSLEVSWGDLLRSVPHIKTDVKIY